MRPDPDGQSEATARLLAEIAVMARRLDDAGAADLVQAEAGALAGDGARVVVAGEKKRGKSSLINALLKRPGLLPVDADIASSVHVVVRTADRDEARAVDDEHPDGHEIDLAQIGEYAALDPATLEIRHPGVREVTVGLPHPLLRAGLVLVDTPGVGGLMSGHAALTLAALRRADALLFVVNGSSELTASECAFLARATERITTVVFALTQTDLYPKWQQVLDRDHALISEHAPRFAAAPWFPVSSRLRLDAVQAADPARGDELEQRSGLGKLELMLTTRIGGHGRELRTVNAACVARRAAGKLIARQERRQRSLARDPDLSAALTAQRERLAGCRRADAPWRRMLAGRFGKLRQELNGLYQRRQAELRITANGWAADVHAASVTQITHDLDAGVQALWADLETTARQGALSIAIQIAAELDTEGIDGLALDVPHPEWLHKLPGLHPTEATQDSRLADVLTSGAPVSMAMLATHFLGALVPPLLPVSAGIAGGYALYKARKRMADDARARGDVQRYIGNVVTYVSVEVPAALQERLETMCATVQEAITAQIAARDSELQAAIAESTGNLGASGEELARQRAATDETLRQLRSLAGLATRLAGADTVPAPAAGARAPQLSEAPK